MKKTFRTIVGILIESSIIAGITYHIVSSSPEESISPVALFILYLSVAIVIVLEEVMFRISWVKKVKQ